ncbi:MAG: hypothetical protein FWD09_05620 [Lentimicrobiaceae bacterium]|nr:hypothetical protein [Lentimicrobiaceae bacterium]
MTTITLDYDNHNIRAQKALENFLALGYFKLHTAEKTHRKIEYLSEMRENEFIYCVSEQVLAKDWLNKEEDEVWKNL